ncbi:O-antigen ligase family protein [Paenibacillus sp. FSL H7-0716]|uniref:O-antigen ligase family protein n=1 Tax=Paenibacillus TaxID=44249 RepID=UPI0009D7708E|nr:O-antigen ligase family protein [Paenibacillus odorifer]
MHRSRTEEQRGRRRGGGARKSGKHDRRAAALAAAVPVHRRAAPQRVARRMADGGLRLRRRLALEAAANRAASCCWRRARGRRGATLPPTGPCRVGGRACTRPAVAGRALGRRAASRPMAVPPPAQRGGHCPSRHAGIGGGRLDGGGDRRPPARARADHRTVIDGIRALFYRDAWRLAAEAPWLGRGGETWRHAYLAAQSRPYVGSQVHNGYLDILLNVGFVGLAAILLMLLAAGWLLATKSPRLLPPFLVIVLHSVVDFDWSYGLFWLLLFWLPALALAEDKQKYQSASTHPQSETKLSTHSTSTNPLTNVTTPANPLIAHSTSTNPLTNVTTPANPLIVHPTSTNPLTNVTTPANPLIAHPTPKNRPQIRLRRLIGTAACCFSLLLGVLSFHAAQGEKLYRQAIMSVDPSVKVELLQQSLAWNPRSPRTAIALSRLLSGEQSVSLLRQSLLYSPENASLSWELAEVWMSSDHPGAALYWIGQSLKLDTYNNAKWVKAIEGMLLMGQKKLAEGNRKEGLICVASGNELLLEYRRLAEEEANKGGQHNDREFRMTEQADDLSRRLSMFALRF